MVIFRIGKYHKSEKTFPTVTLHYTFITRSGKIQQNVELRSGSCYNFKAEIVKYCLFMYFCLWFCASPCFLSCLKNT